MTRDELIKKLQAIPDNLVVNIEGCDCIGEAGDVSIMEHNGEILIERVVERASLD